MISNSGNKFFYFFILTGSYLALTAIGGAAAAIVPRNEMIVLLKNLLPWSLRINFFLLVGALVFCRHEIAGFARQFYNKKGLLVATLCLAAFLMAAFTAPRTHRIFYDEDIYANAGQNIAEAGQAGFCNHGTFEYGEYYPHWMTYNKEPSGWPFMMSLVFQLLGTDEIYAFGLTNFLFSVAVLTVFLISWQLSRRFFTSFAAAFVFMLIPHNIIWHNTLAAEPAAALFAGLSVLAVIISIRSGAVRHFFILALLLSMASQMRPESILICAWAVAALLFCTPRIFAGKKAWIAAAPGFIFLIPLLIHLYIMRGMSWGAGGDKFSCEFFVHNFVTNGIYYFNNQFFPLVFTLLSLAGLFMVRGLIRWKLLILLWFFLFWGIFLSFYAGSYTYGADVRFALLSFMPLSVLAGLGAGYIRDHLSEAIPWRKNKQGSGFVSLMLIFFILASFLQFLPLVRRVGQEAWGARYDHQHAQAFIEKIPDRSIVLTQNPSMFLLWGQNAVQTYAGINHPELILDLMEKYNGHVYFHHNYWCNTTSESNRNLCRSIRDRYDLEKIVDAKEQDYEYGLYRIHIKE